MKKIILSVIAISILLSCGGNGKDTLTVNGEIKNLKKGTLYLQKVIDTLVVSVDSITLDGKNTFSLSDKVESPELYYLTLDKSPEKSIPFFGEPGIVTINTRLDKFVFSAVINGLKNQQLLDEYNKMIGQYSGKRLDLVKADFEAKRDKDSIKVDSIANAINSLIKSKYRYTANFIITHPDNEVAPYLALTEFYDANIKWLDSVNNSLTPRIKESKYGKQLQEYIAEVKSKQ
ncbi:MAG: DUF4369 domain-containing protein [Flavobacteriaceae bacterium]|jgi:hypothetical protein|nr:DUF4369 domain-containing protein [Flavobacteriaceae bacterium]